MTIETKTQWSIEADYIQSCNCDYGCPCEFEAPPTYGHCEGILAYRINSGMYGDVSLDGLGFVLGLRSKAAIHEGDLTLIMLIDERADERQRDALIKICTGHDGGMPFEIFITLVGTMLDPLYVPMEFDINGRNSSLKIGDVLEIALEPIKNPVTGEPEDLHIEHGTGLIFKAAEVVSAREGRLTVDGLEFSWPNKAGFVTQVSYSNQATG